jgi:hypothetical protein
MPSFTARCLLPSAYSSSPNEKAARLFRVGPLFTVVDQPNFPYLGSEASDTFVAQLHPQSPEAAASPHPQPLPQQGSQQGQQTQTGTCLQTHFGTQRVTVYSTLRGTHFITLMVFCSQTGTHTV